MTGALLVGMVLLLTVATAGTAVLWREIVSVLDADPGNPFGFAFILVTMGISFAVVGFWILVGGLVVAEMRAA